MLDHGKFLFLADPAVVQWIVFAFEHCVLRAALRVVICASCGFKSHAVLYCMQFNKQTQHHASPIQPLHVHKL